MADRKFTIGLEALNKISSPFKAISQSTKILSKDFSSTKANLSSLQSQSQKITAFKTLKKATIEAEKEWKGAGQEVKRLASKINQTEKPTKALRNEFTRTAKRASHLKDVFEQKRQKTEGVRRSLYSVGISTKNLSADIRKITLETNKYNFALKTQENRLKRVKEGEIRLNKAREQRDKTAITAGGLGLAAGAAGRVGATTLGMIQKPIGTSIGFEAALSSVEAVALGGEKDPVKRAKQMEIIRKQALSLGSATSFTATQVAFAQENLGRAGFKTNEILKATPGLLNVAKAGKMDLAEATSISSDILKGFKMDASEISIVGDILAKTSSTTNTNMRQMGEGFKYVAPIASQLNIPISQVAGMVGVLADVGIKGSQAGTTLRGSLMRLSAPVGRAAQIMEGLSIKTKDSKGNLLSLSSILEQLAIKTQDMGSAQKMGILKEIVGEEPAAGFLALLDKAQTDKGVSELRKIEMAMKDSGGTAARVAKIMDNNMKGSLTSLGSALEGLSIKFSSVLMPTLGKVIKTTTNLVREISDLTVKYPSLTKVVAFGAVSFGALATAAGGFLAVSSGVLGTIAAIKFGMVAMSVKMAALAPIIGSIKIATLGLLGGFKAVSLFLVANPIGLTITGIALGAGLIIKYWKPIKSFFAGLNIARPFEVGWIKIKSIGAGIKNYVSSILPSGLMDKIWGQKSLFKSESLLQKTAKEGDSKRSIIRDLSMNAPITINAEKGMDEEALADKVKEKLQELVEELSLKKEARMYD